MFDLFEKFSSWQFLVGKVKYGMVCVYVYCALHTQYNIVQRILYSVYDCPQDDSTSEFSQNVIQVGKYKHLFK